MKQVKNSQYLESKQGVLSAIDNIYGLHPTLLISIYPLSLLRFFVFGEPDTSFLHQVRLTDILFL
jgi:hypothetical protein